MTADIHWTERVNRWEVSYVDEAGASQLEGIDWQHDASRLRPSQFADLSKSSSIAEAHHEGFECRIFGPKI